MIDYALVLKTFFIFYIYIYFFPFVTHWKTCLGDFAFIVVGFFFFCYCWFIRACVALLFLGDLCCQRPVFCFEFSLFYDLGVMLD